MTTKSKTTFGSLQELKSFVDKSKIEKRDKRKNDLINFLIKDKTYLKITKNNKTDKDFKYDVYQKDLVIKGLVNEVLFLDNTLDLKTNIKNDIDNLYLKVIYEQKYVVLYATSFTKKKLDYTYYRIKYKDINIYLTESEYNSIVGI